MVIDRLILEFQTNVHDNDGAVGSPEGRIAQFRSVQEFVDGLSVQDGPCAVVRVDLNHAALPPLSRDPSGPLRSADSADSAPSRSHLQRSGRARLLCVGEELRSQARLSAAHETTQHLDQTLEVLSPREWDVLLLMLRGKTCKEMGSELHIGLPTVAKHRARVLKRFGVRDHIELFQLLNNLIGRMGMSAAFDTSPARRSSSVPDAVTP